jgi:hypothetical protein
MLVSAWKAEYQHSFAMGNVKKFNRWQWCELFPIENFWTS